MLKNNIFSNFIPYEGFPFEKDVSLNLYELINENSLDYPQIGFLIRKIRRKKENRRNVIFHKGKNIYSLNEIYEEKSEWNLSSLFKPSKIKLNVKKEEDRFILKLFVGELVASNLRNKKGNWRISRPTSTVFRAIDNDNIVELGKVLRCEAFDYEPYIFENGTLIISIDPKSKLFMNYNLTIDNYKEEMKKAKYYTDYCPLDCEEKKDPFTPCKISTPRTLCSKEYISVIPEKTPKTYFFKYKGQNINLVNYCNLDLICPRENKEKRLGNKLRENKPVFQVKRFTRDEVKKYGYPADRIRFSFDYRFVESHLLRKKLMGYLRLEPEKKWAKVLEYANFLEDLTIDNDIPIIIEEDFITKPSDLYKYLELEKVKFRLNRINATFPKTKLRQNGPCDLDRRYSRNFSEVKFHLIYFRKLKDNIIIQLEDLLLSNKKGELTFSGLFRINTKIIDSDNCYNHSDLEKIKNKLLKYSLKYNEKVCIIPIYDENKAELIDEFRKFLFINNIPSQGINAYKIENKINNQSKVINIFLGIYVKIGGIPWQILVNYEENNLIIGFHKIQEGLNVSYCILIYNSKGNFLGGKARSILKESFTKTLIDDLNNIDEIKEFKGRIIFLGLGNQMEIKSSILAFLRKNTIDFSYYEVGQTGHVNLFQIDPNRVLPARNGIYLELEKDIFFMQTNYFELFVPSTIKVTKIYAKDLIKSDLQEIYNLSQYNPYYISYVTSRLPLPLHASKKAITDILKYRLNIDNIKIPWFY